MALLRVVSCPGKNVAFHPSGQFIITGTAAGGAGVKVWGAAGGSAFSAGKKPITVT